MNSRILIVGVMAAIVLATFIYGGNENSDREVQGLQLQTSDFDQVKTSSLEGKLKSMGAVEVEITPKKLEPGQNMIFDLSLDTHSVDLSYDYTKVMTAQDDNGNSYEVVSWSGGKGSHHLRGKVEFEPLSKDAKIITLTIRGIDGADASFEWNL